MTQPEQPASARGARPQLFSAPSAQKPQRRRPSGQPDFGPSILATIDGGTPRYSTARDRLPLRRVLLLSLAVLAAVALYLGVKYAVSPASAPEVFGAQRQVAVAGVKPVTAPVAEQAAPAQGAAAIENVAAPPAPTAAASAVAPAASTVSVQQMLERPEAPVVRSTEQVAFSQPKPATKSNDKPVDRSTPKPAAPATHTAPAKASGDRDTDLLAAMLPHLKRRELSPTSPAYDKRCGQLSGSAADECRAKFCNGRQGSDAACPAPLP